MDRISLFSSPLFLGFDHFERLVDSLSKADDSYPPYNIEQIGEQGFRITLALAGFKKENINITLENNQLTIRGRQEANPNAVYIFRGIATRQFLRTFVLADGVEVTNAEFEDGLLHVNLLRIKQSGAVKTIRISSPSESSNRIKEVKAEIPAIEEK